MAKATLRSDDPVPEVRPFAGPETAEDALVAEITRLYRQLDGWSSSGGRWRPSPAYLAGEAQIRTLAAQHWQLTSGDVITHAAMKTSIPSHVRAAAQRRRRLIEGREGRQGRGRAVISGQHPRVTRPWLVI